MTAAPRTIRQSQAEALQGGRAGFVSRVAANGVDLVVVEVIFFSILIGIGIVQFLIRRGDFTVPAPDLWLTIVTQWFIMVCYFGTSWSSTGRTIGKSVLGLRVERMSGEPLAPWQAFLRALICASFWPVLLWIFVSRRNAGLHDIVVKSKVVYDWRGPDLTPPVHRQELSS